MKRTSWILGSIAALVLAACGGGAPGGDPGAAGGAGTETGSPGMTSDTAPAPGAMDTAPLDTAAAMDTTSASTDTAPKP
jgi:multidrug efflux pump subunit AcrA (membrane-fusion protein)